MEIASGVFAHKFDQATLEQIDTLRTIRLNLAETMLKDLAKTTAELQVRGLVEGLTMDELKKELVERVALMRERLKHPDVVFADEIDLCMDLLTADDTGDEPEA